MHRILYIFAHDNEMNIYKILDNDQDNKINVYEAQDNDYDNEMNYKTPNNGQDNEISE
ncbi:39539_t:CDS:2 [Gigaspora margarita]|uniref:39539_t:CDS:1 n=1 Tax=Gigaspora margarita TaxID=4874 RepID=A0ABN7UM00_GIGMA|nr:39539_t:CDS:2 [Gigaspora margarita]